MERNFKNYYFLSKGEYDRKCGYTTKAMKRFISLMVAAVCTVSLFSGCGSTADKKDEKKEKVTISVSGWPSKPGPELEKMEKILADFNKKYGDEIEVVPDTYVFEVGTFLPKAASGQLPTLYRASFTEAKRISESGYAADITKEMKKYGYSDKINEQIKDIVVRDGKNYFIPSDTYAMGLMANLNVLKEAGLVDKDGQPIFPETFEQLSEYAQQITKKTGKAGFIMPTSGRNGGWHFSIIAWNNGVNFMKNVDGKWKATFDTKACVDTLQWIKDLKWKYGTLNSNNLIDQSEAQKLYATDQGGYYLGSKPANTLFEQYDMSKDAIAMGRMPAGTKTHTSLIGGVIYAISDKATDAQKDACFKWLEYIGVTPFATEVSKSADEASYKAMNETGKLVGLKPVSPWNDDAEAVKERDKIIDKYVNVDKKQISQYANFDGIKLRTEEPVCCQDLYGILDSCIQEVLTDKNADCEKIIKKAAKDFQANFLDNAQ